MKTLLTYRKPIVALFAIVFALTLYSVKSAQAYTHIYIDAVSGTNAPTGRGSASSPYQSITFALLISARNNLADPWHVHIHPGTYNGDPAKGNAREIFPLKLRREMIFEGTTTAQECIIDGQHTGEVTVPMLLGENTEGVTIRNLTIQNSLRTSGTGGIILNDPAGTKETPSTFEECIIHNNRGGGVWSNMPLILTGNTFSNNHGAGVWTSKSTAAMNNTFSGNGRTGLHIEGDSTGGISENIFENNRNHGFYITGTLKADITDNVFTGNTDKPSVRGGGFEIGTLIGSIANNTFENNIAWFGAGFVVQGLTGDVTNNTFISNKTHGSSGPKGGGFLVGRLTGNITHNTFEGNMADSGGSGFMIVETLTGSVTHNVFTRNATNAQGGGFWIYTLSGSITHNIFDSNSSGRGGGFVLERSTNTVEVFNNIFFNNTANSTGNSVFTRHPTHFMNNLFMISDELSGGVRGTHTIWVNSPECMFHNNIFTGVKTAVYTEGALDLPITHNLFHNVRVDFVEQAGNNLGNDLLFWELVAVNATNNLEGGPQLVDPVTTRDFHLQATSPAINAGTNDFAPADDFDGVIRPVGAIVDIGPYEYGGTPIVAIDDPVVPDDFNTAVSITTPDDFNTAVSITTPDDFNTAVSITTPDDSNTAVSITTPDDSNTAVSDPHFLNDPSSQPTLKLYWTARGRIQRADLDASNIESVINREAVSIALDAMNSKLYWTQEDDGIFRANLDGTNIEHLIDDVIEDVYSGGRIALDVAGGKMYWTHGIKKSIFRANLDGSNAEVILRLSISRPLDIALDVAGGKMYWTQWDGNASISRANLDGSNVELLVKPGDRRGIALDVEGGKMYWTDGFDGIGMANLDGSNIKNFETPDFTSGDITLDLSNGRMYWIDSEGYSIQSGNLDGSQQRRIIKYQGVAPNLSDIALYLSVRELEPIVSAEYPAWDVNEDGKTDITDLVAVAIVLGTKPPKNPRADVNGDGEVNVQDIVIVATHLGESTDPAAPIGIALPERLTPETLQQALDLLRAHHDGSLTYQRAVANLEKLLASLTPKETALLANYPNPFNPETWIPYQLAKPAEVSISIYSVNGTLVRTLSLGHQAVGMYQSRSRAAYWDGRNNIGEPVASGVYFYTLTAGDFTATRKMLIRK